MSTILAFPRVDMKAANPSDGINKMPEGDQAPAACELTYANGGSNSTKKAALAFVIHGTLDQGIFLGLDYFLAMQKKAGVNIMIGDDTTGYLPDFSKWMVGYSKRNLLFKPVAEAAPAPAPAATGAPTF